MATLRLPFRCANACAQAGQRQKEGRSCRERIALRRQARKEERITQRLKTFLAGRQQSDAPQVKAKRRKKKERARNMAPEKARRPDMSSNHARLSYHDARALVYLVLNALLVPAPLRSSWPAALHLDPTRCHPSSLLPVLMTERSRSGCIYLHICTLAHAPRGSWPVLSVSCCSFF